jgi:uncharacterized protein YbaP (TraB family)
MIPSTRFLRKKDVVVLQYLSYTFSKSVLESVMKLHCFTIIFLLLFILTAVAADADREAPFLWKIRGEDHDSYILGSIHSLSAEDYPLPSTLYDAFSSTQKLAVEVNLKELDNARIQETAIKYGVYTDDRTLESVVSKRTFKKISRKFTRLGLDIRIFKKYKPWMISLVLVELSTQKSGLSASLGVDIHFMEKAIDGNMEILELETMDSQLIMFDSISDAVMEAYCNYIVRFSTGKKSRNLVDAWKSGDETVLLKKMKKSFEWKNDEMRKKMFDDRNRAIAGKIDTLLGQPYSFFIITGAGHLVGDGNIVNLLLEKGYDITRVASR